MHCDPLSCQRCRPTLAFRPALQRERHTNKAWSGGEERGWSVFEISACPVAKDKQFLVRTSNILAIFHYFTIHDLSKQHQAEQVFPAIFKHWGWFDHYSPLTDFIDLHNTHSQSALINSHTKNTLEKNLFFTLDQCVILTDPPPRHKSHTRLA